MAEIKGIIYFILGIVVAGLSIFINTKTDSSIFLLFVYVGIFMVVIGAVKMLLRYINEEKKAKLHRGQEVQQQAQQAQTAWQAAERYATTFCNKCRAVVYKTANFCHHCGERMLK